MRHPLRPLPEKYWDYQKARHLLNRAGFGIPLTSLNKLQSLTPEQAVEVFVDSTRFADPFPTPNWLGSYPGLEFFQIHKATISEDERRKLRNESREKSGAISWRRSRARLAI